MENEERPPGGLRVDRLRAAEKGGYRDRAHAEGPRLTISRGASPAYIAAVSVFALVSVCYAFVAWSPRAPQTLCAVAAFAVPLALAFVTSLRITVDDHVRVRWGALLFGTRRFDIDVDAREIHAIEVWRVPTAPRGTSVHCVHAVLRTGAPVRLVQFGDAEDEAEYVAELLRRELGCARLT